MIYWLWLQCALGVGGNRFHEIISRFSSAQKVFEAGDEGRKASGIFNERELKLLRDTSLNKARLILKKCTEDSITVISPADSLYPECLKNIHRPPFVLYVKGEFPDFDNIPTLCVVGTRKVTDYGYKCAYSLSGRLSQGGFYIISGGAKGSDTAAHIGALLVGGKTAALLPHGFNVSYLKENEKLREDILKNGGCLITEFPPDTPVNKGSFHYRNRLMSGLSLGTVVVEAPVGSGAVITASNAVEQNRDVFVIPGSPGVSNFEGSNALLRDGAKPVIELNDIFSEYTYCFGDKISMEKAMSKPLPKIDTYDSGEKKTVKAVKKSPYKLKEDAAWIIEKQEKKENFKKILPENLSKNAKIIYNQLDKQIFTCDDLLSPTTSANMIVSALGELELFGFISSLPGGRYTLK